MPILYWVSVAPLILLILGAQIHRPFNINRIAALLAMLAFTSPSLCWYMTDVLVLYGTFGEFQIVLGSGYAYAGFNTGFIVFALVFVVVPQLVFTGEMWRYYRGIITKRRTTLFVVISLAISWALVALPLGGAGPFGPGPLIPLASLLVVGAIAWRATLTAASENAKVQSDIICLLSCFVLIAIAYLLSLQSWFINLNLWIPLPLTSIVGFVIMREFPP